MRDDADDLAKRTVEAYERWHGVYKEWCKVRGYAPYPEYEEDGTMDVEKVIGHHAIVAEFLEGRGGQSANQAVGAIGKMTRELGFPFDARFRPVRAVKRTSWAVSEAAPKKVRQAMDYDDLAEALEVCSHRGAIGVRDAALLLVGWGYRLDRSDLVGLDWERAGTVEGGMGCIQTKRGVKPALKPMSRKLRRPKENRYPVWDNAADKAEMYDALLRWREVVGLKAGDPIFRAVNNRNEISAERLTGHSVSRIVKYIMRRVGRKRGMSDDKAKAWARQFEAKSLKNRP